MLEFALQTFFVLSRRLVQNFSRETLNVPCAELNQLFPAFFLNTNYMSVM
jgi:hypothetical protein